MAAKLKFKGIEFKEILSFITGLDLQGFMLDWKPSCLHEAKSLPKGQHGEAMPRDRAGETDDF